MASEKGLYWIALGVFALGLVNGPVRRIGHLPQRVVERYMQLVEDVSSRVADRLETASVIVDGREANLGARAQAATARAEVRTACVQAAMARRQAAVARLEAGGIRITNRAVIVRPHPSVRVNLPLYLPKDGPI